jgi:glyoxylase-like metal-dependent hydrolase (beta-lactamase superfamily II)
MKRLLIAFIGLFMAVTSYAESAEIFTFKLGDAQFISFVTARRNISDDTFTTPDLLKKYKNTPNYAESAINYFLLNEKGEYTLFDAGLPKSAGNDIVANLAKVGIKPADIKRICLTHMHGDHIGGLVEGGKAVFPNAELHVPLEEYNYWISRNEMAKEVFTLYSKQLKTFPMVSSPITPTIKPHSLVGHTPGHTYYEVGTEKDKIMILGDFIHANVQFTEPKITLSYDVDPTAAYMGRLMSLKTMSFATNAYKWRIAGMHLTGSGVGRVEQPDSKVDSFRFIPLNGSQGLEK